MLLVAILVTGLMPAAGSWSCPDGTACVFTAGRGFHCLTEQYRIACCAAEKPDHGCGRCEHGAVPDLAAAILRERSVGEPAHCRYREAPQFETAWAPARAVPDLQWHPVAILPAPADLPVVARLGERLAPIRGSPPITNASPPSSPRAPPQPDCA